jgi:hypothetical protein
MKNPENPKRLDFALIKSKLGENNKITKTISVVFLILIMAGLFAFILTGLYLFGLIEFPEFIQNLFFPREESVQEIHGDDRNIYDYLRDAENSGGFLNPAGFTLEFTLENIREVISQITLPDNLYLETTARYYTNGGVTRTEELSLWKMGDKYKYTLSLNSAHEETYINDSMNEQIENHRTGHTSKRSASGRFSFDNIPHISNINYYLGLLEGGEITDFSIKQNSEANTLLIEYGLPELNQREEIYISLDSGLVLRLVCRVGDDGELFYESSSAVREAYFDGDEYSAQRSLIHEGLFVF